MKVFKTGTVLSQTSGAGYKTVLVFVREQNHDEYGNTMSYVFLGDANFIKSSGSKPMNIEWKLNEPMSAYLWKESGKLAVG